MFNPKKDKSMNCKTQAAAYQVSGIPLAWDKLLGQSALGNGTFGPHTNILEGPDYFELQLLVPGFSKESIALTIKEEVLVVTGDASKMKDIEGMRYKQREFAPKSFVRKFRISDGVDSSGIKVQLQDGLLRVSLPKRESVPVESSRLIPIE
jgi:HSP20 family protein